METDEEDENALLQAALEETQDLEEEEEEIIKSAITHHGGIGLTSENNDLETSHIVYLNEIKTVSDHIGSDELRARAGTPTSLSVSDFIAIGTLHGSVLVYDKAYNLKAFFETPEHGAVTALEIQSINANNVWLICGHQNGHLILWDVLNKKQIKAITSHHATITSVRFLKDARIIACDLQGVMNVFSLTKMLMMFVIESQMILNGSAGTIFAVEPFLPLDAHPMDVHSLVAIATIQKVHVLSLYQSTIKILFSIEKTNDVHSNAFPCLSWASSKNKSAILAISWGNHIELIKLEEQTKSVIKPHVLRKLKIQSDVAGLEWLDSKALILLTSRDQMSVYDPFTGREIETLSAKSIELVYHTRFSASQASTPRGSFKNLQAAAVEPRYSFSGSICSFNKSLYLLGFKKVFRLRLLNWDERIAMLMASDHWTEALKTCRDFYEEKATIAIGLPKDPEERRQLLEQRIIQVILAWSDDIISKYKRSAQVTELTRRNLEILGHFSVDYCLMLQRTDVLFGEIYEKFKSVKSEGVFLEILEPFIVSEQIKFLHPEIMQQFVDHYASKKMLGRVEQCILHMDIMSLDFHQVATLCKRHYLFQALIYIHTRGLGDFVTPLEEICNTLSLSKDELERREIDAEATVKVAMDYIKCSIIGKAYPDSSLPSEQAERVKLDVIKCITFIGSKESPYPRFLCLLSWNAKQILEIISSCFDVAIDSSTSLLSNMLNSLASQYSNQIQDKLPINSFIAKYVVKGKMSISNELFDYLLYFFLKDNEHMSAEERQEISLQLVQHTERTGLEYDRDNLLVAAEGNAFYKVANFIYERKRNFGKMLICHIKDPDYKNNVFNFIRELIASPKLNDKDKEDIKNTMISNLQYLLTIDSTETSKLIIRSFTRDHERILRQFDSHPELQFKYLSSIMSKDKQSGMNELLEQTGVRITSEMHELYVKLMCKFAPDNVYLYLVSQDNYPLDACLRLCKQAGLVDATIYLLERTGDVPGALTILIDNLKKELKSLENHYSEGNSFDAKKFPNSPVEQRLQKLLSQCTALCQRNGSKMDDAENAALWFRLTDVFANPLRVFRSQIKEAKSSQTAAQHMQTCLNHLMQTILFQMASSVGLPTIVKKIVNDHGKDEFGDFKALITGMLDTYTYERTMLQTANHLVQQDMYNATRDLTKRRSRGFRPKSKVCGLCRVPFLESDQLTKYDKNNQSSNAVVVFMCGHGFHNKCLTDKTFVHCPICTGSNTKQTHK